MKGPFYEFKAGCYHAATAPMTPNAYPSPHDLTQSVTPIRSTPAQQVALASNRRLLEQGQPDGVGSGCSLVNESGDAVALVRLLTKGRIPCSKTGSHRRVRASDVLAFKKQRAAAPQSGTGL